MSAIEEVLAASRARAEALATGDAPLLGLLLHPEFRWTSHLGQQLDRDDYIERNTGGQTRWRRQDLGDPEVVVVGATAVLRTVVADTIDTPSGPEVFRMPMTQCWVLDDERWQCLAGHAGPRL